MTIRHLRVFLAVCESGTTVAAAEALRISQPSVSAAVTELERFYGVRLFDRIGKRLHLTDAGSRFRQYALHVVSLFDQMEREVRDSETMGVLRVGSSITIGKELLPGFLTRLKERYPALRAEVVVNNSDHVERAVLENEIDIGFVEGATRHEAIYREAFYRDRLVFLCHPGHAFAGKRGVPPEALAGEDFLYREKGSAGRELADGLLAARGVEIRPLWQSISTQTIVSAVRAGLGVAVLPYLLVRDALGRGEVAAFEVEGIAPERSFAIIRHRNKYVTRGMQALEEICRE